MPIDIDGESVTDLSIDGEQVTEVTADGDIVWQLLGDHIYTGTDDEIIATDMTSQEEVWLNTDHDTIVDVSYYDGMVYSIDDGEAHVRATDSSDGSNIWSMGFTVYPGIAVSAYGDYVGAASYSGEIRCLDADSGGTQWINDDFSEPFELFISDDEILYAGVEIYWDSDERPPEHTFVIGFDCNDGSIVFEYEVGDNEETVNSVYADDGVVYISPSGGSIIAVDANDESLLWEESFGNDVSTGSLFVSDGVIYTAGTSVAAIDESDRSVMWTHEHSEFPAHDLVVVDDIIYTAGGASGSAGTGEVIAADTSDGSLNWDHYPHDSTIEGIGADYR